MEEWDKEEFKGLLTPNIWKSSYETVKQKIHMPLWNNDKYKHLLIPSIFAISANNITNSIALLETFKIGQYATNRCLRMKTSDIKNLIEYLIINKIDLIVDDDKGTKKLNPILSISKAELKDRYGIDVNNLYSANNKRGVK